MPGRRPKPAPATHQYFFTCGKCRCEITVEPNQALSRLDCRCGAMNMVPSLLHLQRRELAANNLDQTPSYSTTAVANHSQVASPGQQGSMVTRAAGANCPYCGNPMQAGRVIGERYKLKWLAAEIPLTMGVWAVGGIPIGQGGFMQFNRPHIHGWRCAPCGTIIVSER